MPISIQNINGSGGLTFLNQSETGKITFSSAPLVFSGDLIRASLSSAFTASYDSATIGTFILVDSSSYLSVSNSLSAITFGMNEATMNGPNGTGTAWGSPFAFNFYQDGQIPSGSYVIAFSTVYDRTGTVTSAVYYGTGSSASGSSASILGVPFSSSIASTPASGARRYYIRKAPTDALPTNSWMYMFAGSNIRVKGPVVNPVQYKSVGSSAPNPTLAGGSYSNWTGAGAPSHQFLYTPNKQW